MKAKYQFREGKILVSVTYKGSRIRKSTGINIAANKWNNGYPIRSQTLIREKLMHLSEILDKHLEERDVTRLSIVNKIEHWVKGTDENVKVFKISKLIDLYIKDKKLALQPNTLKKKESRLSSFNAFKSNKEINDINKKLLNEYVETIYSKGLEDSSVNNYIKDIKALLNWAYNNDYTTSNFTKMLNYIKLLDKDTYSVTEKELEQLKTRTNSKGVVINISEKLNRICDLFIFDSYTGLRYSDVKAFKKEMIVGGNTIEIRVEKTNDIVRVPLLKIPLAILEKYEYELPKYSSQKANEYLKELFTVFGIDRKVRTSIQKRGRLIDEIKPLNHVITYHLGRKSFITIGLMNGVNRDIIKAITGHKTDREFRKYVAFTNEDLMKELKKRD